MTMFETRILCHRLPQSINNLDKLMPTNEPSSTCMSIQNNNNSRNESLKQYRKQIRDYKRDMLMETLKNYERSIEENEYVYQQEFFSI